MMGAGKTTVGRQLAKRLGKTFYDADREIEARTGVRVALDIEDHGDAHPGPCLDLAIGIVMPLPHALVARAPRPLPDVPPRRAGRTAASLQPVASHPG